MSLVWVPALSPFLRQYERSQSNESTLFQVRGAITNGKHLDLMEHDQLHQEKLAGHAFIGFHEADITFKPTYKFDPGLFLKIYNVLNDVYKPMLNVHLIF